MDTHWLPAENEPVTFPIQAGLFTHEAPQFCVFYQGQDHVCVTPAVDYKLVHPHTGSVRVSLHTGGRMCVQKLNRKLMRRLNVGWKLSVSDRLHLLRSRRNVLTCPRRRRLRTNLLLSPCSTCCLAGQLTLSSLRLTRSSVKSCKHFKDSAASCIYLQRLSDVALSVS